MLERIATYFAVRKLRGLLENRKTYLICATAILAVVASAFGVDVGVDVGAYIDGAQNMDVDALLKVLIPAAIIAVKAGISRHQKKVEAGLIARPTVLTTVLRPDSQIAVEVSDEIGEHHNLVKRGRGGS